MPKMPKTVKYTIFETKWGYFGLAAIENSLLRTHLPYSELEKVETRLLENLPMPHFDKGLFKMLQQQITAYFEGTYENFGKDVPIITAGFSPFAASVLTACRDISFGQTISYGQLAKKVGRPRAARAIGRALAKNPLPLIIPCHRVICANGKIGGFSAAGGIRLKKRMLELEHQVLAEH